MLVEQLRLKNFAWYDSLQLRLGPGLALVLGRNGAGKSTSVEGICWALYGETVRGSSPERSGACTAAVSFQLRGKSWTVDRVRQGPKVQLVLGCGGEDRSGQTVTETQHKIDDLLGSWDRFAATRVFAREFMARFGAATDRGRKALLEDMLGLEQFDAALSKVRVNLNLQEKATAGAERAATSAAEELARLEGRFAVLDGPAKPSADVEAELTQLKSESQAAEQLADRLSSLVKSSGAALSAMTGNGRAAQAKVSALVEQLKRLESKWAALSKSNECGQCGRPIGADDHVGFEEHYHAERGPIWDEYTAAQAASDFAKEEAADANQELQGLEVQSREVQQSLRISRSRAAALAGELAAARAAEGERARLQADIDAARLRHVDLTQQAEQGAQRSALLSAVSDVLGLRGARTLLLGRALSRLEAEANRVLAALGYPISLTIGGRLVQKSGKEVDAISIGIDGQTGDDYAKLSTSERARVDTALLLGLASMLSSEDNGLLVFDEVFDSLDEEGIEPLASYLAKLSETRQVIVISHHPEIRALFPRAQVFRARRNETGASTLEAA